MYENFNKIKYFLNHNEIFNLEKNRISNTKYTIDTDNYIYLKDWWSKDKKEVDASTIIYKLNNLFFRSRHFEQLDINNTNILFGGCSQTFGEGLPENCRWTDILIDKIKKTKNFNDVVDYNVAMTGDSIDLCIKNLIGFVEKYGKPNYIFACLPDLGRSIFYSQKHKDYKIFYMNPKFLYLNDPQQKKMIIDYQYEDNVYRHSLLIKLFENYCRDSGIKLFWTTWDNQDAELYKDLNFSNFVYMKDLDPEKLKKKENMHGYKFWAVAEDKDHFGSSWTSYLAEQFLEKLNDKTI
jgi:hypothetical protein